METRAHHVLIGLFTVLVVAGAMLFGLWLAKSSVDDAFKDYEVVFNEAVSGLSRAARCSTTASRSATWHPAPGPERPAPGAGAHSPVRRHPGQGRHPGQAGPGRGHRQLDHPAQRRHAAKPALKGKDGKLPVIIASPSPISRLLNDSSDLVTNINLLLHNANQMFSEDNIEHLSNTLANLDQTTGAFADQRRHRRGHRTAGAGRQAGQRHPGRDPGADAQRQRPARHQGKQAIGSAEQAMQSLAQSSATINSLLQDNSESSTTAPRA
jgi:phospholipid/cholesterol/gamma-HCH transport system substrate-binding protein